MIGRQSTIDVTGGLRADGAEQVDVVVVGGGISGLAAAWSAKRAGASVVVLEASACVGGVMATETEQGFTLEMGPTSMMGNAAIAELIRELKLDDVLLRPNAAAKRRYVLRDGQLHAVPMSIESLFSSKLLSTRGKLRVLGEPFIARASAGAPEESLGAFVSRRFGAEVRDYLVDPFVSGVYAGDVERLSSHHALPTMRNLEQQRGSVIGGGMRMMFDRRGAPRSLGMISFRDGLGTLPRALASRLGDAVRLESRVSGIARSGSGWNVSYSRLTEHGTTAPAHVQCSRVILATPAHALRDVAMPAVAREELEPVTRIAHAPIAMVSLGFRRADVSHPLDGFGMLAPSSEKCTVLGALFVSSIFDHRAPDGHVLITCFLGGSRSSHDETSLLRDPDEAARVAISALRPLLGIRGDPVMVRAAWRAEAIPQYELGYSEMIDAIMRAEQGEPGLGLIGSYRGGVSVGDCVASGLAKGVQI